MKEIEQQLVQHFGSLQDKVTSFGVGSVIRAIFTSVAAVIAEIWNDLNSIKRSLFWSTSTGTDLDRKGDEEGLTRLGETYASSIGVFKGEYLTGTSTSVGSGYLEDSTKTFTINDFIDGVWILIDSELIEFVITGNTAIRISVSGSPAAGEYYILPRLPIGTIIKSAVSGLSYATQEVVDVGKANLALGGESESVALGSRSVVICTTIGNKGRASANELTIISPAINGVISVTNPVPTGENTGLDNESDDQFRARRRNFINLLNVDTQAFYEALAIAANENILRSVAKRNLDVGGITVYVLSRSGALFTSGELADIKAYIELHAKAFVTATVANMVMTDIFVSYECRLKPTATLQEHYVDVADAIATYLNFALWVYENLLYDDRIADVIIEQSTLSDLDLSSLSVVATKGGVSAGSATIAFTDSLPRLARLSIKDLDTGTTLDYVLQQLSIEV